MEGIKHSEPMGMYSKVVQTEISAIGGCAQAAIVRLQRLNSLSRAIRVALYWVRGHTENSGTEKVKLLAKKTIRTSFL